MVRASAIASSASAHRAKRRSARKPPLPIVSSLIGCAPTARRVATADVGRVAAQLLQETWTGRRIVELGGPRRVTPDEIAATLAEFLCRPVRSESVPRGTWDPLFRSQGMQNPIPRIRMLDGFNEGWIEFEDGATGSQKGEVALKTVLKSLVEREGK